MRINEVMQVTYLILLLLCAHNVISVMLAIEAQLLILSSASDAF